MKFTSLFAIAAASTLAACGGSGGGGAVTPVPVPVPAVEFEAGVVTTNADGSFTIAQGGETINLPASRFTSNGQLAWQMGFNGGVDNANSFITDDVTAIGGVSGGAGGTAFSGITGTLGDAPAGDATFDGRFAVSETSGAGRSGPISLVFDLSGNTLESAAGAALVVDGDVASNGQVTGSVTYGSETAEFEGGFYGDDAVAGAFNNDAIGGVFYGTN
ncbi:hypothetical protein K3729_09485 [Rhodobacteraceae bacterium S2214]|nr:hypothetical protein K3729_09485 [Rhodobacteraceae bacterium S2214]